MSVFIDANLSISSYLNKYYSSWHQAQTTSSRKDLSENNLTTADATALRKALKSLQNTTFTSANGGDIYNSLSATITTFNHLMDSTSDSSDQYVSSKRKQIKQLIQDNSDTFGNLGITMKDNGQLSVDEDVLSGVKVAKVQALFGSDSDFSSSLENYAHKIQLYEQSHKVISTSFDDSSSSDTSATTSVTSAVTSAVASSTGVGSVFDSLA